jgi:hypothetical protein
MSHPFKQPRGASRSAVGGFDIPGSTVSSANVDLNKMLNSAYEANVLSASRRYRHDMSRKGYTVSESEAVAATTARIASGDLSEVPEYARILSRSQGAQ